MLTAAIILGFYILARDVKHVSPLIRVSGQVVAGNANWNTSIEGVDISSPMIRNYEIAQGAFFTSRDIKVKTKVVVLGQTVVNELFPGLNPLGTRIRIGAVPFDVVGVLSPKGQSVMENDQDDIIFVPSSTALYRMGDGETVHGIMASAVSKSAIDQAQAEMASIFRTTHGITSGEEDDFEIRNQTEIVSTATQVTITLTMLLSDVAGGALLVGWIGGMNIMLVSVTEGTGSNHSNRHHMIFYSLRVTNPRQLFVWLECLREIKNLAIIPRRPQEPSIVFAAPIKNDKNKLIAVVADLGGKHK